MVDIQSKEVIDKISDELKIQPSMEIPRELGKNIQLNYDVNPLRFVNEINIINRTTTASAATVFTTPSDRDFFLTGVTLANVSDATADNTTIALNITLESGVVVSIILLRKLTTTAFDKVVTNDFTIPIKLLRGSPITFINAFTVGASVSSVITIGYTTDPQ